MTNSCTNHCSGVNEQNSIVKLGICGNDWTTESAIVSGNATCKHDKGYVNLHGTNLLKSVVMNTKHASLFFVFI